MSLQVWLPLNGNLNNQGLNGNAIISGTPSYSSSGKIGNGCLNTSNMISIYEPSIEDKKVCSFAFWAYITGSSITSDWTLVARIRDKGTNSGSHLRFEVCPPSKYNGVYCFSNHNNSGYAITSGVIASKSGGYYDQWVHFCFTSDGTTLTRYMNGVKEGTCTYDGPGYFSGYFDLANNDKCFKQDVRIYDHCLSAKEVKEISKGLICHYKLDNNGFGNPNLIEDSSFLTNATSGSVYRDSSRLFNGRPTLKITRSGATSYTYTGWERTVTNVKAGDTIYASAWVYIEDPSSIDSGCEWRVYQTHNDGTANNWSGWYSASLFKKGTWVRVGRIYTLDTNLSSAVFSMNVVKNGTYWIAEPKVEHGTKPTTWCPHTSDSLYTLLGLNSTTESDCSGLLNNGTKIGGLTPSTSPVSIRYESCYNFDGNTGSIQIPNLATLAPSGEFTMNCWIYHDDTWSSKTWETIFGGPSGFELEAKPNSTNSPSLYAYSWGKGEATYELNKWNMITMTRNASEAKFYINGELKITGSAGTIPSGNYFIGAWNTSSQQNYKGRISDFRLYSNVLSASDIKELYTTSASVDKNGNMYAYEFKEE